MSSEFDRSTSTVLGVNTFAKAGNTVKSKDKKTGLEAEFASHQQTHNAVQELSLAQPQQYPAVGVFQNGGSSYTDFHISQNLNNRIASIHLEMTLSTADGSPNNLSPYCFAIQRVEFYSGSNIICLHDNWHLYFRAALLNTTESIISSQDFTNIAPDFIWTTAAKPATISTACVDISGPFIGTVPGLLREQLRCRVYWADNGTFSTPALNLTSTNLLIESVTLIPEEMESIRKSYASNRFIHRFHESRTHEETWCN